MATTTNYGWVTPDDTDLVKDGAAAIRTLGTSVDTTVHDNEALAIAKTFMAAKGDLISASANDTPLILTVGANGTTLVADSSEATGLKWQAAAAAGTNYAIFTDTKSSGTAGGTFTSGAQRTRDLNTTQFNNITGASLASNQVTLLAGTYYVDIAAIAFQVDQTQARLQNITDSTTEIVGETMCAGSAATINLPCIVRGGFTITATKVFEVQHRGAATAATNGFGLNAGFNSEVYTIFSIAKIG